MSERIPKGTWVQIHQVILAPGERAPGLPEETARVPYECWIKGLLLSDASPGEVVTIETSAGRQLTGRLAAVEPGHTHSFGAPHRAMLSVGPWLRRLLEEPT